MKGRVPPGGGPGARAGVGIAALLGGVALVTACALDANRRRIVAAGTERGLAAVAAELPSPDVAFTGGGRWLRAPALEEPGAAQADGIAFPDPEPGGGAINPPRAAWAEAPR